MRLPRIRWRVGLLLAALCSCVCASQGLARAETGRDASTAQIVLATLCGAAAAVALALAAAGRGRGVPLVTAAAALTAGVVAWAVTHGTTGGYDALQHTEPVLRSTAHAAEAAVAEGLRAGAAALTLLEKGGALGAWEVSNSYPASHLRLAAHYTSLRASPCTKLYYTSSTSPAEAGTARVVGVGRAVHIDGMGPATGTAGPVGSVVSLWFQSEHGTETPDFARCAAADRAVEGESDCAASTCTGDVAQDFRCQATCATATNVSAAAAYCSSLRDEPPRVAVVNAVFNASKGGRFSIPQNGSAAALNAFLSAQPFYPSQGVWWLPPRGVGEVDREIHVTGPHSHEVFGDGSAVLTLSARVYDTHARFAGVAACDFSVAEMTSSLVGVRPYPSMSIVMTDSVGRIVVDASSAAYLRAAALAAAWNATRPSGVFAVDGHAAIERRMLIAGSPFVVLVAVPMGALSAASTDEHPLAALLGTFGLAAVFGLVGVVLMHVVLAPVRTITEDLDRARNMHFENALDVPVLSPVPDIAALQDACSHLFQQLAEYQAFLPSTDCNEGLATREIAVVFTDIRSSTTLWERLPNTMMRSLALHNSVIRNRISHFEGFEVKTIGDAFMVVFETPEAACLFGMSVQEDLLRAEWPEELLDLPEACPSDNGAWRGITIRVGIHYGCVDVTFEGRRVDYFGSTVNIAARVEGACVPGAVCVTQEALAGLSLESLNDPTVLELGTTMLKGVAEAMELSLLVPQSLAQRVPDVKAALHSHEPEVNEAIIETMQTVQQRERQASIALSGWGSDGQSSDDGRRGSIFSMSGSMSGSLAFTNDPTRKLKQHLNQRTQVVGHTLFRVMPAPSDKASFSSAIHGLVTPAEEDVVLDALSTIFSAAKRSQATVGGVLGMGVALSWSGTPLSNTLAAVFRYVEHLDEDTHNAAACRVVANTGLASGKVLSGNVGAGGQRFATVMGPTASLAAPLAQAAAEVGALALYSSLERSPATSFPRLKKAIRPVDRWTVLLPPEIHDASGRFEVLVYEVHRTGFSAPPSSVGWSLQYWTAFAHKNVDVMEDLAGSCAQDDVLTKVLSMMRQQTHLRGPVQLCWAPGLAPNGAAVDGAAARSEEASGAPKQKWAVVAAASKVLGPMQRLSRDGPPNPLLEASRPALPGKNDPAPPGVAAFVRHQQAERERCGSTASVSTIMSVPSHISKLFRRRPKIQKAMTPADDLNELPPSPTYSG